ncbi:MAG TPA: hypothetical protein VE669_09345 [Actinomycetota bacterium]|nr:hypothetical protein [Actinomycetota bacterium]
MNLRDVRPALGAGWPDALRRGFIAFAVMAGLGQALALAVWALAGSGRSLATFARIGWLYVGAFHHVAIELEGSVTFGPTGSPEPGSLALGVALLAATWLAVWLLFRAGCAVADRAGGGTAARTLHGAKIAPAYASPMLVLAVLVSARIRVDTALVGADVRAALDPWQALVIPMVLAMLVGAAGGFGSALAARPGEQRLAAAAAAGGWRMFSLGLLLSFGGLFVAGVVQPDEVVALVTPSSARYYQEAFDRPEVGTLVLTHHVGLAPNEAVWTLVPAMGGCDGIWGDDRVDVLCYGRFPTSLRLLRPGSFPPIDVGGLDVGRAPAGYFLFLLVPAAASAFGGRRAAESLQAGRRRAVLAGVLAGGVFAALVTGAALLSVVTVRSEVAGSETARWLVGPNVLGALLGALVWGTVGGAAGAATVRPAATAPGTKPGPGPGGTPPR